MAHILSYLHDVFADTRERSLVILAAGILIAGALWGLTLTDTSFSFGKHFAAVVIPFGGSIATSTTPLPTPLLEYLEVMESCGSHYEGTCVNMRSGPGEQYPAVAQLRTGVVLRVSHEVVANGHTWAKVQFDAALLYSDRLPSDLYVATDFVRVFYDDGNHNLTRDTATTTKRIVIDLSEQMLYAYDGDALFMQESISTGLELTPTTVGTFRIFKMTPARYMQGPLPGLGDQVYDLPGVPWDMYFTTGGAVIHGAYWHDRFGERWSHGCVNLPPQKAKQLYEWTVVGTPVKVQN